MVLVPDIILVCFIFVQTTCSLSAYPNFSEIRIQTLLTEWEWEHLYHTKYYGNGYVGDFSSDCKEILCSSHTVFYLVQLLGLSLVKFAS